MEKMVPMTNQTTDLLVCQSYLEDIIALSGYSSSTLACKLQLSYSTIYRILTGRRKHSKHLTFKKILSLYCRLIYFPSFQ